MSLRAKDLRTFLSDNNVEHNLRRLIYHIAVSCKYISTKINEANRKYAASKNLSGEEQLELDKAADALMVERLKNSPYIREFASEEQEEIIIMKKESGEYSVTVDPLDGSSLVDVNLAVGTIVGIHNGDLILANGQNLAAAMYVLYGPLTTLVLSIGKDVQEFVLNPEGEFILINENVKLNDKGKLYAIGGLKKDWGAEHSRFVERLESEGYKLRYSGGLVPDFNHILLKGGGVFTYPQLKNAPQGKLRLLFELQPLAFIIENAGGMATDGKNRILDIIPEKLHQKSGVYFGSRYEIELAKSYLTNTFD